jgi:hypothetical protein
LGRCHQHARQSCQWLSCARATRFQVHAALLPVVCIGVAQLGTVTSAATAALTRSSSAEVALLLPMRSLTSWTRQPSSSTHHLPVAAAHWS